MIFVDKWAFFMAIFLIPDSINCMGIRWKEVESEENQRKHHNKRMKNSQLVKKVAFFLFHSEYTYY